MVGSPWGFPTGDIGWRRPDARIERLKGVGGDRSRVVARARSDLRTSGSAGRSRSVRCLPTVFSPSSLAGIYLQVRLGVIPELASAVTRTRPHRRHRPACTGTSVASGGRVLSRAGAPACMGSFRSDCRRSERASRCRSLPSDRNPSRMTSPAASRFASAFGTPHGVHPWLVDNQ